jgi:hypothetical protein
MVLIAVLSLLPARLFPPSDASIPGTRQARASGDVRLSGCPAALGGQPGGGAAAGSWRLAGAIGYGLLMEVFQLLGGGGRMFSWGDAAANAAGVLLFWAGAGRCSALQKDSGPG